MTNKCKCGSDSQAVGQTERCVIREAPEHYEGVNRVAFSPDPKTIASGGWEDENIKSWDLSVLSAP